MRVQSRYFFTSSSREVPASRIPTFSEGSPRVVLEALANQLPLVSTPVGSVPEFVVDGESGLIVPFRSSSGIADAVERFAADAKLRERCARAGFEKVKGHTVDRFLAPMIAHAKKLCAGRRSDR